MGALDCDIRQIFTCFVVFSLAFSFLWNIVPKVYKGYLSRVAYERIRIVDELKQQYIRDIILDSEPAAKILELSFDGSGAKLDRYPSDVEVFSISNHKESSISNSIKSNCRYIDYVHKLKNLHCIKNEEINYIIATFALKLSESNSDILKEIVRVLKEGGKFYYIEESHSPKNTSGITADSLSELLIHTGFVKIKTTKISLHSYVDILNISGCKILTGHAYKKKSIHLI